MSERKKGATSVSLEFRLTDITTGAAKTGVDVTTLKLQYHRPGEAPSAATSLTLLATPTTVWTAFGAKEVDATNSPGVIRVDTPDAGYAGTPDEVVFTVNGATIQPATRLIDLLTVDLRVSSGNLPTTLVATGLDAIATTAPTGPAATFREMMVQLWRGKFKKSTMTATQVKTFADDGTTIATTQTVSDDGTTQTQGAAT